jgi:hypothetical protein
MAGRQDGGHAIAMHGWQLGTGMHWASSLCLGHLLLFYWLMVCSTSALPYPHLHILCPWGIHGTRFLAVEWSTGAAAEVAAGYPDQHHQEEAADGPHNSRCPYTAHVLRPAAFIESCLLGGTAGPAACACALNALTACLVIL